MKKEKPPLPGESKLPSSVKKHFLTKEQFYEWKTYALLVQIADLKYQLELTLRTNNANKIEVEKLRHELALRKLGELSSKKEEATKSFESYKKELESDLGISLNDKVIDNITYEIKDLS